MHENLRFLKAIVDESVIAATSTWIQELAEEFGLGHEDTYRIDMCFAELVTNVAHYSETQYHGLPMELRAAIGEQRITFMLSDPAQEFNPLAAPPPPVVTSIEEMQIGGQGIHLVREFSNAQRYERANGMNRLEIVFDLAAPTTKIAPGSPSPRGVERRNDAKESPDSAEERRLNSDRRDSGFLSHVSIFRNVPYATLEGMVGRLPIATYAAEIIILKPGDQNSEVLIVLEGRLKIYFDTPDGNFVEIGVGGCVGEMSVIDGQPASTYVVSDIGTKVLVVDAATFLDEMMAIPGVSRNLMSALADRMRRNTEQIISGIRTQMQLERNQAELQYARSIQESLLPRPPLLPDEPRLDCVGRMLTAREVGGDFFDIFTLDNKNLFFVIADVCGKGLPAALFMVRAVAALRAQSGGDEHPATYTSQVIARLNQQLCARNDAQQFLTAFCGTINLETRTVHYVNAGHNAPLFTVGDGPFAYVEEPINPIVGMIDGLEYRAGELVLPPQSVLLLYTDGVTEAENSDGGMLGEERLLDLLNAAPSRDAGSLVDSVFADVMDFAGDAAQSDDITVMAIRLV